MNKQKTLLQWIMIAILAAPALTGCSEDFLDRKPLGVATNGDIALGGFEEKVFGLYGTLRTDGVGNWTRYWFQSIRSDDASKGSLLGDASVMGNIMEGFQYTASNTQANEYWTGHYKLIYACNLLILFF